MIFDNLQVIRTEKNKWKTRCTQNFERVQYLENHIKALQSKIASYDQKIVGKIDVSSILGSDDFFIDVKTKSLATSAIETETEVNSRMLDNLKRDIQKEVDLVTTSDFERNNDEFFYNNVPQDKNIEDHLRMSGPTQKKDPTKPDRRYRENRIKGINKDGTLDMRCKQNWDK